MECTNPTIPIKIAEIQLGESAINISSRAIAVSAYLFVEELFQRKERGLIADFAKFYVRLLNEIKSNMDLLSGYK